jgi:hypothetical protein
MAQNGLIGTYYNNPIRSGTPVLTRIDPNVNFNWNNPKDPGQPTAPVNPTNFSVRWTGQLQAPVTGTYTFSTNADDAACLWINNQLVLTDILWNLPAKTQAIDLQQGQFYDVVLDYMQATDTGRTYLSWTYPGQEQQIIPSSALFPTTQQETTMGPIPANLTNLALNQPATASSYWSDAWKPEFGNNGNIGNAWAPKYRNGLPSVNPGDPFPVSWWQVDLSSICQIWSIELVVRQDGDRPWSRYNFAIWASNNVDMSNPIVLGGVGSDDLVQYQGTFVLRLANSVNVRYIRATKLVRETTNDVDFGIADFRVWGSKG